MLGLPTRLLRVQMVAFRLQTAAYQEMGWSLQFILCSHEREKMEIMSGSEWTFRVWLGVQFRGRFKIMVRIRRLESFLKVLAPNGRDLIRLGVLVRLPPSWAKNLMRAALLTKIQAHLNWTRGLFQL